jgi:type IV pilus assembly protein PilC
LRAPVFGQITKLSVLSEVSRTISLLVSSGTSLINAINISADVSGNIYYKNALNSTSGLVEKGAGLSVALQNQLIFPPLMVQMVKVGESTGKIDESLLKVSEYFERDLDIRVRTLTTAIEPILIIILGVSVAFLIISVITPIYSLVSQIQ